jgi:hypothetical protein
MEMPAAATTTFAVFATMVSAHVWNSVAVDVHVSEYMPTSMCCQLANTLRTVVEAPIILMATTSQQFPSSSVQAVGVAPTAMRVKVRRKTIFSASLPTRRTWRCSAIGEGCCWGGA